MIWKLHRLGRILMDFYFDKTIAKGYKSNAQKIRVMSEHWVENNIFCPCCGKPHTTSLDNNKPVADFQCDNCGEIYELKSKKVLLDFLEEVIIEK